MADKDDKKTTPRVEAFPVVDAEWDADDNEGMAVAVAIPLDETKGTIAVEGVAFDEDASIKKKIADDNKAQLDAANAQAATNSSPPPPPIPTKDDGEENEKKDKKSDDDDEPLLQDEPKAKDDGMGNWIEMMNDIIGSTLGNNGDLKRAYEFMQRLYEQRQLKQLEKNVAKAEQELAPAEENAAEAQSELEESQDNANNLLEAANQAFVQEMDLGDKKKNAISAAEKAGENVVEKEDAAKAATLKANTSATEAQTAEESVKEAESASKEATDLATDLSRKVDTAKANLDTKAGAFNAAKAAENKAAVDQAAKARDQVPKAAAASAADSAASKAYDAYHKDTDTHGLSDMFYPENKDNPDLENTSGEIDENLKTLNDANGRLKSANSALDAANQELNAANTTLDEKKAVSAQAGTELNAATEEYNALNAQLTEAKNDAAEKASLFAEASTDAKAKKTAANADSISEKKAKDELAKAEEDHDAAKNLADKATKDYDGAKKESDTANTKSNKAQANLQDQKENVDALNRTRDIKQSELKLAKANLTAAKTKDPEMKERAEIQADAHRARLDMLHAQERHAEAKADLKLANNHLKDLPATSNKTEQMEAQKLVKMRQDEEKKAAGRLEKPTNTYNRKKDEAEKKGINLDDKPKASGQQALGSTPTPRPSAFDEIEKQDREEKDSSQDLTDEQVEEQLKQRLETSTDPNESQSIKDHLQKTEESRSRVKQAEQNIDKLKALPNTTGTPGANSVTKAAPPANATPVTPPVEAEPPRNGPTTPHQ